MNGIGLKNKTRTRINKTLARLRSAYELLGGVSLSDGVNLFVACHPVHRSLGVQIARLEKCLPPKSKAPSPTPLI